MVSELRNKIELEFIRDHSTERAVMFQEKVTDLPLHDKGPVVGSLYMMKEALGLIGDPEEITVTIKATE